MTKRPPLLCRWFGHKYGRFDPWITDRVFGSLWVRCCERCDAREVYDEQEYQAFKKEKRH